MPVGLDQLRVDGQVGAQVHLDDAVHALRPDQVAHALHHVLLGVQDGFLRTCSARVGGLQRVAHRGNNACTRERRKLDGVMGHTTCAALHQNCLSRYRTFGEHRPVSSAGRNPQTGPLQKIRAGRQAHDLFSRQGAILGGGAHGARRVVQRSRVVDPDPGMDKGAVYTIPHRHDYAGAVGMGHNAWEGHGGIAPAGAHLGVRGIDAGRMDPNQHFARSGLWRWKVAQPQYAGCGTGLFVPGSLHDKGHSIVLFTRHQSVDNMMLSLSFNYQLPRRSSDAACPRPTIVCFFFPVSDDGHVRPCAGPGPGVG